MEIIKKNVDELLPADYNPRKDLKPGDPEYEKLKRSIEQFGYVDPVIWNKRTGCVVGGHQRLKVLKDSGITELECVVVDLPLEKEKALNIALNKISGDWDKEKLALLITDLQGTDLDVSLTGFDTDELDMLFRSSRQDGVQEDGFDVDDELKKPAFSKPGDIWALGKHRVICGDSTDKETYERLVGSNKINLVCTDAPYFVNLDSTSGKIKNDDLNDKEAYEFLLKAFKNMHEVMASDASIYEFYATSKARVFHDAFEDAGFKVGAGLVWKKDRLVLTRTDWKYIHEPIIFGWRTDGKHKWYGDQKQITVFEFDRIKSSKEDGCGHPSSKPIPLIAYLIGLSSQTNAYVLDAFLGSASTLIASEQLNRVCFGIEIEPKFVDVAVNRYIQLVGKTDEVKLERDGLEYSYEEAIKLMESENNDQ